MLADIIQCSKSHMHQGNDDGLKAQIGDGANVNRCRCRMGRLSALGGVK